MYLNERDTRALLSILIGKYKEAAVKMPALTSMDGARSEFTHFGTRWDVGHILAASHVSWKTFEKWFKEERAKFD